ncbi:MAG: branched-chain amino acid aminotransferase [Rhodospirillaceae bacterium]
MSNLPYDDRDGVIWMNGALVPWRDAKVHVLTHGLHYGSCVFEGERFYNGRVFKLTEHSERLAKSAELLGFTIPWSVAEIDEATKVTVAAQGFTDGYVRPVAWRGSEMMGVAAQQNRINLAIAVWEWGKYLPDGVKLETSKWRRPSPDCAPVAAKAAGLYMICTLSKHAAENNGNNDALMLDYRGQVAEATGANIFLIREGRIHTPLPDCFLDGITRRTVIDLARARGLEVIERAIWPNELSGFEEIFLTGTAAEVTPVGRIDGLEFKAPGPITRTLMDDYTALVRR